VKKVIGAILVLLVLCSGPAWAKGSKGSNGSVNVSYLYTLKADLDTSVLVSWWVWSLAVQSGNQENAWFAYALMEQAMTSATVLDELVQAGGAVSYSYYDSLRSCRKDTNRALTYFYQGKTSNAYKYFSRASKGHSRVPAVSKTNSMYVTLKWMSNYTQYLVTGVSQGGSCDDGNACTQNDTWSNGQCIGSRPMSPTAPGC